MAKKIAILGSTGSIGQSTLEVVRQQAGDFQVVGLAAGRNAVELARQVREFQPEVVSVANEETRTRLRSQLQAAAYPEGRTELVTGASGVARVATAAPVQMVVAAMVGFSGLVPTYLAIQAGKDIALANKETLVAAGRLIMDSVAERQVRLLPVDSEHNAVFQCLHGENPRFAHRIWLTASGGPFLHTPAGEFGRITPERALQHPTWKMGPKITIDSATLMNKGLEVIEAHWLFGAPPEAIEVVIHPQSTVHSLVEFVDGSILAQLGVTDMKIPIRFALNYPERAVNGSVRLDLFHMKTLEFIRPDFAKFPCLALAYAALAQGGGAPTVLNAANEVAVAGFLEHAIPFDWIPRVIRTCLEAAAIPEVDSLEDVLELDRRSRETARAAIESIRSNQVKTT